MGSWSAEDPLSNLFGRGEHVRVLWVRIADHVEYPSSDGRHFILRRDSEEGRERSEIWHFIPFRESVGGDDERSNSLEWGGEAAYSERYTMFRSVTKSVAGSEDRIRGQPLGDSAAASLALPNMQRSAGERKDIVLAWTQKSVVSHSTSTFPSSR